MTQTEIKKQIESVIQNMPNDWLKLTTHRLDIYNEELAKTEFIDQFLKGKSLELLPTAYDYIRLGHPLSCILEWGIAENKSVSVNNVISFSSQTMPLMAILRKSHFEGSKVQIVNAEMLPKSFDMDLVKNVYGYEFELVEELDPEFKGHSVALSGFKEAWSDQVLEADFIIYLHKELGSVVVANLDTYVSEIQHVRRRESIAMTPHDCFNVLREFIGNKEYNVIKIDRFELDKTIQKITNTSGPVGIGSCGLSAQYAIMMGLIEHALNVHPGKEVKFIVPPNCYGGTNDQARRVAACLDHVEIIDLKVDSGNDMVDGIDHILEELSKTNAVPYIIAEIPTNPRVEVPDLERLKKVLSKERKTSEGETAIESVFILDQTFCPDTQFLGEGDYLGSSKALSYVSGSKFPSGGLCTAGYVVANELAIEYMDYVQRHLEICDNGATTFQIKTLTEQMPSMVERIKAAYKNTREFVSFIEETLPESKINFVPSEVVDAGFTPSVFSLDLPTRGESAEERELNKRELNQKLITLMINEIPGGSKHCVSYGQLKGSYWTIPATSTQGTTKEGDKDYIVRVSMSPEVDLNKHKEVFKKFCTLNY